MIVHDGMGCRQAQASHAIRRRAGGHKQALAILGIQRSASGGDFDAHQRIFLARADGQRAAGRHRVQAMQQKIFQRRAQLIGIGLDHRLGFAEVNFRRHRRAPGGVEVRLDRL